MKKLLIAATALATIAIAPSVAHADEISVSTSIDYATEYVFRGTSFGADVIQPGVEAAFGDFYAGVWGSLGVGDTSILTADEIDYYAGYGFTLSDTISADVGLTIYHFPQFGGVFDGGDDGAGFYEPYFGLSFDTALAPSVYAYYETETETLSLVGSVGHSIPMGDKTSLDLGLEAGYVDDVNEYATGSAAFSYAFTDDVSAYVSANYSLSSEDTLDYLDPKDNAFFFGTGIAAGF